ncbi:MAG: PEP-CTERM sorting domain-containing protein, partial [Kiritimatiellales bacterium]
LGENTFIEASALITVSSSGYLYSYNNSSAVNYGSSIAVDGGTAVMSGGTLQGGLHGFSSGGIDVQNGCAWYAGDYLKALDAGCAVALSGGTLYSTDVIAGNFSFAEGGVHLQGGAHDTTYFDTSLSLSSKDLYIETGAAVELAETQPSFQDNEHVHVAGGTLTVDGVGAGQIDVVSGTLNITGQNNITHFLDVSGGTVNLSAFAWNPFETLTGGEIHVLTGGTWYAGNELGDIADDAQVVLDGGTLTLYTAFDANDFTWNSGVLSISSCLVSGDLTVNGELDVWSTAISGNLDFNAGSRLSMSASDRFLVEGLAQLNGGTLDISLSGSVTNGAVFDLFDWSGGISGTFDEILINGVAVDEEQWDLSALYTGGSIQSVPEPTTLLLILFGGGIAWLARLKQRF